MTELIEVNVANLSGEALNWAVGKAEGLDVLLASPVYGNPWRVFVRYAGEVTVREVRYAPQESWADGGPLIQKHRISIEGPGHSAGKWRAFMLGSLWLYSTAAGTPLEAACQRLVYERMGDTVQVPKELI